MDYSKKSSIAQIRKKFDASVEKYSDLEAAQKTLPDAALAMELIAGAALCTTPDAVNMLDVGCGAGNNTLKFLQLRSPMNCDLLDLSAKMLDRARKRVVAADPDGVVRTIQADFREARLPENRYDVVFAAAVLHHLRDDADWRIAFKKLYAITAPGGGLWITDLICHDTPAIEEMMRRRYADYLVAAGGAELRDWTFETQRLEDTPRSLNWQLALLKEVGFERIEILHKTSCFAAFGGVKPK
ncbi:MAG: class I SAM-dependent methyltransferase [Victivallaceae bacterium]|nr:class I SAM-dependent methyltransferase [Victivallaceae bacterium]